MAIPNKLQKQNCFSTSTLDNEGGEDSTFTSSPAPEVAENKPVITANLLTKNQKQEKIFENLRLCRIVKENHGQDINQVAFHLNAKNYSAPFGIDFHKTYDKRGAVEREESDNSNVLATIGDTQANIYDNEHYGDHLDIMSHFILNRNSDKSTDASQELLTCCWLHREGDALLAMAGQDTHIHIVSVACSKEVRKLQGHAGPITDLQVSPKDDRHILSASRDGTVRLWDVDSEICLHIYNIKASVVCFDPTGTTFLTGGYTGDIREWSIPDLTLIQPQYSSHSILKMYGNKLQAGRIDCMRYIENNVLSKTINGKVELWNPNTLEVIQSFHIRNGANNRCRFDISMDNKFFCVGNSIGAAYIYNIESGKMVTKLYHRRSTKAIRCCAFSRDCRNVICAGEDSFIWRYDYINEETLKEWASKNYI